jgi:hypothetical protein
VGGIVCLMERLNAARALHGWLEWGVHASPAARTCSSTCCGGARTSARVSLIMLWALGGDLSADNGFVMIKGCLRGKSSSLFRMGPPSWVPFCIWTPFWMGPPFWDLEILPFVAFIPWVGHSAPSAYEGKFAIGSGAHFHLVVPTNRFSP